MYSSSFSADFGNSSCYDQAIQFLVMAIIIHVMAMIGYSIYIFDKCTRPARKRLSYLTMLSVYLFIFTLVHMQIKSIVCPADDMYMLKLTSLAITTASATCTAIQMLGYHCCSIHE
jgi:hypothetical protein